MDSVRRNLAALFKISVLLFICARSTEAGGPEIKKPQGLNKTATNNSYQPFSINNVFNFYGNNGDGSFNLYSPGNEGFEFPKGLGSYMTFEDGLVWGGYHKGRPVAKVGGSTYWHGLQAGPIVSYGTASTDPVPANTADPSYRIYRVRPDINPHVSFASVQTKIDTGEHVYLSRYVSSTDLDIYNQYINDWTQWPASQGAPFQYGKDSGGVQRTSGPYNPNFDIPGKPGADQTLWYVANDMNAVLVGNLSGSPPIGLEIQRLFWGYKDPGIFGNTVFQSTILINKSGARIDSMFIVQWADPDIGGGGDDFPGCDTSLSLGYAYNGANVDATYGSAVPAEGFTILQGPRVPSPADSATFLGRVIYGYRNLRMSAFAFFSNGSAVWPDPLNASSGEAQWYRVMRGTSANAGAPLIDPNTALPTRFAFAGDPATGTGWNAVQSITPTDVRIAMVMGPFTMAAGDTQEVIMAHTAARGGDRLASVVQLKAGVRSIRALWAGGVKAVIGPVDTLYAVHDTIALDGAAESFGGASGSITWSLLSGPVGSSAQLSSLKLGHITIIPDLPGVYHISLVASGVRGGNPDTAYVDLKVSAIQRPVVQFASPAAVTLGDTIRLDASASFDPNGRQLAYSWQVGGSRGLDIWTPRDTLSGYLSSQTTAVTKFVPLRTSLHTVNLNVSNGVFTEVVTKTFPVNPLSSPNVSVGGHWPSGSLPYQNAQGLGAGGFYGWGGIKEIDGNIWVDDDGTCAQVNFANYAQPGQIYNTGMFGFDGGSNYLAAFQSTAVYVAKTDGHGAILSQNIFFPFASVSADTGVRGVLMKIPYLLLPCAKPGLLVYNISNPVTPLKVNQYTDGENWSAIAVKGTRLYAIHPATNKVSVVDISALPTVTTVGSMTLSRSYTSIASIGQYFYLIKTSTSANPLVSTADTLAIYDFANVGAPVLKGVIPVPKTLNPYNRFNAVSGYGNTIIASTAEGVYLFDVTNPAVPAIAGEFLTGSNHSNVFMNASHLLTVNLNRVGPALEAYEGLLDLYSPFTSVANGGIGGIPLSTQLEQNFPNPFNPLTTIRYGIPARSHVNLTVYNALGQRVATLVQGDQGAGYHEVKFDGTNLASGVYFYRLQAGTFVQTKKLLLVK